jgi:hypothetical protein
VVARVKYVCSRVGETVLGVMVVRGQGDFHCISLCHIH